MGRARGADGASARVVLLNGGAGGLAEGVYDPVLTLRLRAEAAGDTAKAVAKSGDKRHDTVRAIINGHIHQEFQGGRDGITVYGTPSTNVQFRARSDQPGYADLEPGYRRLALHPDGRIETQVVRATGVVRHLNTDGSYE